MKTKHPKPIRRTPETGWRVVDVIDLKTEEPMYLRLIECERCNQSLRFVHVLSHPDEPDVFVAGRCCASRMSAGYDPAPAERELMNRWNRRQKFPDLAGWKTSRNGNPYLRDYHGCSVTVFRQNGEWHFVIVKGTDERHFSPVGFTTVRDAKLSAFDAL